MTVDDSSETGALDRHKVVAQVATGVGLLVAVAVAAYWCFVARGGIPASGREERFPVLSLEAGSYPALYRVETFGSWSYGELRGRLRLAVTRDCSSQACFDRAYLQWIEPPASGASARRVRSVLVEEISEREIVHDVVVGSGDRLQLVTQHGQTGDRVVICISPGTPGDYRSQKGPC